MSEIELLQAEADGLLIMEKVRASDDEHDYPSLGSKLILDLRSRDGRESFFLDLYRGRIDIGKGTYQNRARVTIPLARLDFGGQPHTNPDGETIGSPHLHLYREGFGLKWAYPLEPDFAASLDDPWELLDGFYRRCAIIEPPRLRKVLFS